MSDYFTYNEKRLAQYGKSPTGTYETIDGSRIAADSNVRLVDVIEMEGRTFRHFRAIHSEELVKK